MEAYKLAKEAHKGIIAKANAEAKEAGAAAAAAAAEAKLAELNDWRLAAELTYGKKAMKNH